MHLDSKAQKYNEFKEVKSKTNILPPLDAHTKLVVDVR